MKKILVGLLVILIVLSASAFILIPKELTVSKVIWVHTNENVLFRYLSNQDKWAKWWPNEKSSATKKNYFTYNSFSYRLSKIFYKYVEINMLNTSDSFKSRILIIPITPDSVAVKWESNFKTSVNPFIRIAKYEQAKAMRKNMEVILDSLKAFNENKQEVYSYNIHRTTIKDTFMVATKITTTHYPTTKEIYDLVANLKKYIKSQQAKETNYPMLNVTANDSLHYTTMVAIPTDKELEGAGNISIKRMIIYQDKTVTAEIKGGPAVIKKAYEELNTYMTDYNLSTPVIHWESLVTDRSKETDSTKWITRIFMPIV